MTKNPGICWFCGGDRLSDLGDYMLCPDCGATTSNLQKPAPPLLEDHAIQIKAENHKAISPFFPLSKSAKRRVLKARKANTPGGTPKRAAGNT